MTTEQWSVDSLLPKSRTETFARQLQNRLRTLNGDEVNRVEDTSWNGDQHSSSSEDIYYDLDSYPGSPAEEATEVDFTNYINVKTVNNVFPSSTIGYPPQNSSVQSGNNVEHLGQCSRIDQVQQCNNSNGTKCFTFEPPEEEFTYGQCSSSDIYDDETNFFTPNNKLPYISNQNGLSETHHLVTENTDEIVQEINGYHSCSYPSNCSEEIADESNSIINRLQCNGSNYDTHNSNINDTVNLQEIQSQSDTTDCTCTISNGSKSVNINRNSAESNNNVYNSAMNSFATNLTIELAYDCYGVHNYEDKEASDHTSELDENECNTCLAYENCTGSSNQQVECKKENYTEEDLSKLVDAVFLKSHETDFDDNSCEAIKITIESETNKLSQLCIEDEEETIESKRSKFRRCSSLKTGKTPPGTPGCKKIVRFADVLGLDLADVRTFLDEVPKVPKSAFFDLKNVELSSSPPVNNMLHSFMLQGQPSMPNNKPLRTIVPLFQQPSSQPDFLNRIRENFVCLENAVITDPALSVITGLVRVRNIDFHKSVHVRYSIDNWQSFADLQAKYTVNSCDGFSDKFTFVLYAHMLNVGQRLEFAVRYHAKGSVYWDNNLGANYTFQCVPEGPSKILPTTSYVPPNPIETWASFY